MTYARVAGVLYLIVFLIAPFAEFFVRQELIVAGDPAATAANITSAETLFRAGFATDLVVFVIESPRPRCCTCCSRPSAASWPW